MTRQLNDFDAGWGNVPTSLPAATAAANPSASTAATQATSSSIASSQQVTAKSSLPPPPLMARVVDENGMITAPWSAWNTKLWSDKLGQGIEIAPGDLAIMEAMDHADHSGTMRILQDMDNQALWDAFSGLRVTRPEDPDLSALVGPWTRESPVQFALTGDVTKPVNSTTTTLQNIPAAATDQLGTLLGDTMYWSASGTRARLAGSTSATMAVLTQTGTGTISAAPVWTATTGTGSVVLSASPTLTGTAHFAALDSTGAATLGASSTVTATSTGTVALTTINNSNGTAAAASLASQNDAGTACKANCFSSGSTATLFGQTLANCSFLGGTGASLVALLIGQAVSATIPVIFGVGSSEVARFTSGTLTTGAYSVKFTTDATSATTGGLITAGGLGVAKAAWIGGLANIAGVLTAANTTDSTSGTTGGTIVSGGLGVAKSIFGASKILSTSPTAGVGYATGAGGTITQLTNKTTGVTLNTLCGAITMNNAALAAGTIVSFVLTDSAIAATDVLVLNHISGGTPGSYTLNARAAAGSATIDVRNNTAGSLSEAIVIQFAVIKAVNA